MILFTSGACSWSNKALKPLGEAAMPDRKANRLDYEA